MRARLVGHCETLTIEPIDRAGTFVDDDADEPYAAIGRSTVVRILAQVEDVLRNRRAPNQGGARLPTTLSVTFLTRDLKAKGYEPADGDLVTARTSRHGVTTQLNLYVAGPKFAGATHYGNELVICDLSARDPRQSNEGLGIVP